MVRTALKEQQRGVDVDKMPATIPLLEALSRTGGLTDALMAPSRFANFSEPDLKQLKRTKKSLYGRGDDAAVAPEHIGLTPPDTVVQQVMESVYSSHEISPADYNLVAYLVATGKLPGVDQQLAIRQPSIFQASNGQDEYLVANYVPGFSPCTSVFTWRPENAGDVTNIRGWGIRRRLRPNKELDATAFLPGILTPKKQLRHTSSAKAESIPALDVIYDMPRLGEWQHVPPNLFELGDDDLINAERMRAIALSGIFDLDTSFLRTFPELEPYYAEADRLVYDMPLGKQTVVRAHDISDYITAAKISDRARHALGELAFRHIFDAGQDAASALYIPTRNTRDRSVSFASVLWKLEDIRYNETGNPFNMLEMTAFARLAAQFRLNDSEAIETMKVLMAEFSEKLGYSDPIEIVDNRRGTQVAIPAISPVREKKLKPSPQSKPRVSVGPQTPEGQRLKNVVTAAEYALVLGLLGLTVANAGPIWDGLQRIPRPAIADQVAREGINGYFADTARLRMDTIYQMFASGVYIPEPGNLTLNDAVQASDRRALTSPFIQLVGENAGTLQYMIGIPHDMAEVGSQKDRIVVMIKDDRGDDIWAPAAISEYIGPTPLINTIREPMGEIELSNTDSVQTLLSALQNHRDNPAYAFWLVDAAQTLDRTTNHHLSWRGITTTQPDRQPFPVVGIKIGPDGQLAVDGMNLAFTPLLKPDGGPRDVFRPGEHLGVLYVLPGYENKADISTQKDQ